MNNQYIHTEELTKLLDLTKLILAIDILMDYKQIGVVDNKTKIQTIQQISLFQEKIKDQNLQLLNNNKKKCTSWRR
jgi:hypothetical protein